MIAISLHKHTNTDNEYTKYLAALPSADSNDGAAQQQNSQQVEEVALPPSKNNISFFIPQKTMEQEGNQMACTYKFQDYATIDN